MKELMPGDVALGLAGDQLKTLLGSCVSVILTDSRRTVAAMCHIVYVGQPNAANVNNTAYGQVAMDKMFDCLRHIGVTPRLCEAYVFGGGNMFPKHSRSSTMHIGRRNGEAARALLQAHGIPIVSESLFGIGHRQIIFDISTGDVWSHQVRPTA